jgi:hypothetical protein
LLGGGYSDIIFLFCSEPVVSAMLSGPD